MKDGVLDRFPPESLLMFEFVVILANIPRATLYSRALLPTQKPALGARARLLSLFHLLSLSLR